MAGGEWRTGSGKSMERDPAQVAASLAVLEEFLGRSVADEEVQHEPVATLLNITDARIGLEIRTGRYGGRTDEERAFNVLVAHFHGVRANNIEAAAAFLAALQRAPVAWEYKPFVIGAYRSVCDIEWEGTARADEERMWIDSYLGIGDVPTHPSLSDQYARLSGLGTIVVHDEQ